MGRSEKVKWFEEKSIGAKRRTLVVVVGLELGVGDPLDDDEDDDETAPHPPRSNVLV